MYIQVPQPKMVRTRYAPSPTGHLHIGGARTALFSYLFAKAYKGQFILRFEDTDRERHVDCAEDEQMAGLKWLGITWDEGVDIGGPYGPYRQTERLHIYSDLADGLIAMGHAYECYCSSEELGREKDNHQHGTFQGYSGKCRNLTNAEKQRYISEGRKPSIRYKTPKNAFVNHSDFIRGNVSFDTNTIDDFILVRPNGIPTYNFAVAVDDYMMRISHVIRGEEHLSNTPKQILIYKSFGWATPHFAHLPLILNASGSKMSKRDENITQFIHQYMEQGYLPNAVVNFLALLGWSPKGEQEIFGMSDLISLFSLDRVSKAPAIFDPTKMAWVNEQHMKNVELDMLTSMCIPSIQQAYPYAEISQIRNVIQCYKHQIKFPKDAVSLSKPFLSSNVDLDISAQEALGSPHASMVVSETYHSLMGTTEWNPSELKSKIKNVQLKLGLKAKDVFGSIRSALMGTAHGLDLAQVLMLLGKEISLKRLKQHM